MSGKRKLSEFKTGECKIPSEDWIRLRDFVFENRNPSAWFVHSKEFGIRYFATAIHTPLNHKEYNIHYSKENSDLVKMITFSVDHEGSIRSHYKTYNLPDSPTDEEHPAFPPDKWLHASRREQALRDIPRWLSEIAEEGIQFPTIAMQLGNARSR